MAAIIVGAHDQVLAIKRSDDGRWEPPGGVLELDERIEAGLRREVHEETGLRIEVECITGVYKNLRRGVVALVFRCRSRGGRPRSSEETRALRWMTPTQVKELMDPVFAVRVFDALKFNSSPNATVAIRDHDGVELRAS